MSKSEFLRNVKTARNLFFHRVQTDHPTLDPRTIEAQLARAAIWLTPSSVNGFNPRDFLELSETQRDNLKENVRRFVEIAKNVPPTEPATKEQIQEAMQCFQEILSITEAYMPSGAELEDVRDALEAVAFPDAVLTLDFELGIDSSGDPALWVWVFVDSDVAASAEFTQIATDIRQLLRDSLTAAGVTRWPYIRFRTASEQRSLSG